MPRIHVLLGVAGPEGRVEPAIVALLLERVSSGISDELDEPEEHPGCGLSEQEKPWARARHRDELDDQVFPFPSSFREYVGKNGLMESTAGGSMSTWWGGEW